jgi:XTP/dITP diphosphohydrolase
MELIIATHNKNKVCEFQRILAPLDVKVSAAKLPEVDETGKTFAENAYIKAASACRATGMAAVADDSGLSVDALGGAPGVYSARYAGDGATDEDRINKLLQNLKNVPVNSRTAKFVCSICCAFPNGDKITAQGECKGKIAFEPRGNDGFGYDPVFLVGDSTFAEISGEEKDKISHRGKALRIFAEKLKKYKGAIYAEQ